MPFKIGTTNVSDIDVTENSSTVSVRAVNVKKNGVTTQVWGKRNFTVTVSNYSYISSIGYSYADAGGYSKTGTLNSTTTFDNVGFDENITITATAKNDTAQYHYSVTGAGTFDPTSSSTTIHGSRELRKYTIYWNNYDGTRLETDSNVSYGSTPTYDGATPTKPSDNTYTYTFNGWSPDVTTVTGDATYTASYSRTYINYTITFEDWDGSTISSVTYHYGETILPPADPTRQSTAQYDYTFAGWNPTVPATVSGDATFTATYTETLRSYTVWWNNWDGTNLETDYNVTYGTTPSYDGSTPTRASTSQYDYTFSGWSPSVEAITGDTTYIAQFSSTTRQYTITLSGSYGSWKNSGGTVISSIPNVNYGTSISVVGNQLLVGSDTYTFYKNSDTTSYNYIFNSISLNPPGSPVVSNVTATASVSRYSRPYVYITAGTGVSSVYTSTNSTATSGNASGTRYDYNSTVYGFAVLSAGYDAPSGWTLISGTAGTAGAKYRVGTKTSLISNYDFGTKSASPKQYTITLASSGGYWTNEYGTQITSTTASYGSSVSVSGRTLTIGSSTYTFVDYSGFEFSSISGAPSTITGNVTITGIAYISTMVINISITGSAQLHIHYQNSSGNWVDSTITSNTAVTVKKNTTVSMVSWSTGDGTYSLIKRFLYSSCEGDVYEYLGAYGYYYDNYNYAGKTTFYTSTYSSVQLIVSSETSQEYSFNQNIYTSAWVDGSEIQYNIPNDNTPSTSNNKFSYLSSGTIRAEYQTLTVYGNKYRKSDSWVVNTIGGEDLYAEVYLSFNDHGFANKISFYASGPEGNAVYFQYCNLRLR